MHLLTQFIVLKLLQYASIKRDCRNIHTVMLSDDDNYKSNKKQLTFTLYEEDSNTCETWWRNSEVGYVKFEVFIEHR